MIIVTLSEPDRFRIEAHLRPPRVYLDQDSLCDIAKTVERKQPFIAAFATRGTLLFSWTSALDVSGPQGRNVSLISDLLSGIGSNWIPLELDPWKVVRKESGIEPSSGVPCVSESFLETYYPYIHGGPLDLSTVVNLMHRNRAHYRREVEEISRYADEMVQSRRRQFLADQTCLDRILPPAGADPKRPAAYMLRSLERLVTREARGFRWTRNDGVDFLHATVASSFADYLLLDKHWKRRVLEVAPARTYKWVYYRAELDEFLEAFEACQPAE
jgi:hypothetical protein